MLLLICLAIIARSDRIELIDSPGGLTLKTHLGHAVLARLMDSGLPRGLHQVVSSGTSSPSGEAALVVRAWLTRPPYQTGKELGIWACSISRKPIQISKVLDDDLVSFVTGDSSFGYVEVARPQSVGVSIYNFKTGKISTLTFSKAVTSIEDRPVTIWTEWKGFVLYSPHLHGAVYALKGASQRFKCKAKSADLLIPEAGVRCDLANGIVTISSCLPPPSLKPTGTIAKILMPRLLYGTGDGRGHIAILGEDPLVAMDAGRRLVLLDIRTGGGTWFKSRTDGPLHWSGSTLAHYFPLGQRELRVTPSLFAKPLAVALPPGTPILNWLQRIKAPKGTTFLTH
jgi:hypothetical protein